MEDIEKIPEEEELNIIADSTDVVDVILNENGCEIIGKNKGSTGVTFKCNGVTKKINVEVNEKSVYSSVDIGQYVDIGVYYDTPSAVTFTPDRTETNEPLTGWRVLSKDDTNQTVKLISAGCPIAEYVDEFQLCYYSQDERYNYTNKFSFLNDCFGLRGCDFQSYSIGNFLQETCKFYNPEEGVHGFGFFKEGCDLNPGEWCEDDLGECLRYFGFKRTIR